MASPVDLGDLPAVVTGAERVGTQCEQGEDGTRWGVAFTSRARGVACSALCLVWMPLAALERTQWSGAERKQVAQPSRDSPWTGEGKVEPQERRTIWEILKSRPGFLRGVVSRKPTRAHFCCTEVSLLCFIDRN